MSSNSKRFLVFGIGLLLFLNYGCGSKPAGSTQTPVILITLDTLRSDYLPDYGATQTQTPALSAFRRDAVLFHRAFSHTPLTLPSHATIMTGLLPEHHGVRDNTGFVLDEGHTTLAEVLSQNGYKTGAVVSSMVLRHVTGMAQGFDFYEDHLESKTRETIRNFAQRQGDVSVALARKWLTENSLDPVMLWLHLYDPHTPYTPPQPFKATYDGEIAYTDSLLNNFFNFLKEKGLYDKALILVMSDHGEGLGDHGEEEHGLLLYRESIQVPFLIKYPNNQMAGKTVSKTVGLVDVLATVQDVLGLQVDKGDGISLANTSKIPSDRAIYIESLHPEIQYGWHAQKSSVQQDLHLIKGFGDELFNLEKDPGEKQNLFGSQRIPKPMVDLVERDSSGVENTGAVSAQDRAMLESLGYTGSFNFGDNVKSLTFEQLNGIRQEILTAQKLLNQKEYVQVEEKMLKLVKDFPAMFEAKSILAVALSSQKKYEQAEHVLMETLASTPKDYALLTSLASVKLEQGKWDDAFKAGKQAMEIEPDHAGPVLLEPFFEQGRFQEANELAAVAVAQNTSFAYAYYILGRTSMMKGDLPAASANLEKAASLFGPADKVLIPTLVFLAECQAASNQPEKRLESLVRALELDPTISQTRGLLAEAYLTSNQLDLAESVLAPGLSKDPDLVQLQHTMARIRLRQGKMQEAWQLSEKAMKADFRESIAVLSFAWLALGKPDDIEKMARLGLRYEKKQPYSYYLLGRLAHVKQDFSAAQKQFQESLKNIETWPDRDLYADLAFFLGDTEASLGDPNKARIYFQKAVELKPFVPRYQLTLATLFARAGDAEGAKKIVADWLARFPNKNNFQLASQAMTAMGFAEEATDYNQRASGSR